MTDSIDPKEAILAAAEPMWDPGDALVMIDHGTVKDAESAAEAVSKLLSERPYLRKAYTGGSADQGFRTTSNPNHQLTREHLARMSLAEIAEADQRGQFDELLGKSR